MWFLAIFSIVIAIICWLVMASILTKWAYRRRLKVQGLDWHEAESRVRRGRGVFIVDYTYGYSIGIGDVTVWYCDSDDFQIDAIWETIMQRARLVDPPDTFHDAQSLKDKFGVDRVIENFEIMTRKPLESLKNIN